MSADEFWKDDPQLFVSYRTSFINKTKKEREEFDYKCWYQGLYIHKSTESMITRLIQFLHNMFSKKKDTTKIETYPKKPYTELAKEKEKNKDNQLKYNEQVMVQGSIKQLYLERLKQKNKK